jgi:hypothetical protein
MSGKDEICAIASKRGSHPQRRDAMKEAQRLNKKSEG